MPLTWDITEHRRLLLACSCNQVLMCVSASSHHHTLLNKLPALNHLHLLCFVRYRREKKGLNLSLLVQAKESTLYFIVPTVYIKSCQFKANVPTGRVCLCEPVHAVVCLQSQSLLGAAISCFTPSQDTETVAPFYILLLHTTALKPAVIWTSRLY